MVHLYPVSHPDLLECEDMSDPDNPQNLELKGKKNQEIKVNHRIFRWGQSTHNHVQVMDKDRGDERMAPSEVYTHVVVSLKNHCHVQTVFQGCK